MFKFVSYSLILIFFTLLMTSCGIYKKTSSRDVPTNAMERARKNVKEGRGISIKSLRGNRSTSFEFSTSNPMWRSAMETLDFLPLSNVDYSGGVIISDWYNDSSDAKDSIKITVRFLSNEIRADSVKVIVHKRNCNINNQCVVNKIDSKIEEELQMAIIKKAALLEKEAKKNKK